MTENTMVEKIAKLLAKAERAGSPEEAEAFFAKAQELMTKWAIDEATVRAAQGGYVRGDVTCEAIKLTTTYARADATLMAVIADENDCKVLMGEYCPGYGVYAYLYGFQEDIERVKMIWTSLLIQCARQQKESDRIAKMTGIDVRTARKSFRYGFSVGVRDKLRAAKADSMKDVEPSLLPVLKSKMDMVLEEAMENAGGGSNRGARVNAAAFSQGKAAGVNADVNQTRLGGATKGALNR